MALNVTYYGTLVEAEEYFTSRLHEWAWSQASSTDKENALILARRLIDGLAYKGFKHAVYLVVETYDESVVLTDAQKDAIRVAEASQVNEFPRGADTEVPEDIRIAQYELAHSLLDNKEPEMELEMLAVASSTYGGVKTTYERSQLPIEHLINMIPNAVAWRLLRPYLRDDDEFVISRVS